MYELGMLQKNEDIKLLILFAARSLAQPVEKDALIETISPGETVNYFDLMSVFDELLETGHIDTDLRNNKLYYMLTPLGVETIKLLERSLPFTIRDLVSKKAVSVLAKLRYESMVYTEKEKRDNGCLVTFNIREGKEALFELKLLVANDTQADGIIRVIKKDPSRVYRKFIDILAVDVNSIESPKEKK